MLIDTHAHINFNAYKDDGDEVIKRALGQGVYLVNVGSQFSTSRRAVEYAQRYNEGVYAAVGLHPFHLVEQEIKASVDESETAEFTTREERFDYEKYYELAVNEKVVAIGEAGLDYNYFERMDIIPAVKEKLIQRQKEAFIRQTELAIELGKPMIIHCREAHNEVIEILRPFCHPDPAVAGEVSPRSRRGRHKVGDSSPRHSGAQNDGPLKGVIHSFSGRWSQAQQYLNLGFYLGFNGIITFARDYDRVVREMPLDRLILETDCPYLTPEPHRGKRNEPAYVKYVAQKIADLRGVTFEKVAKRTTESAKKLFGII